ncbi:GroES-like protein [Coleophoma cylindrospora]|uniref:GroES-like protein n=1 Tax=Coleophoma cylindrospora TaxID=1849047 RepID=A0A3D8RFZ3_9HELO|nr:GroES-like protein [Coleophoma cylindrospora]
MTTTIGTDSFSIPQQMRAAQIVEYNQPYTLSIVAVPQIGEDDLLVKVYAAGFCHSDFQVLQGQFPAPLPMIPSHEPVGIVVQVGSKATKRFKPGDRVGVLNFKHACGKCVGCTSTLRTSGRTDPRFCEQREAAGFRHDGAFAEYMVADSQTSVALPSSISFEQGAPLMCAGATVWGALCKALPALHAGDTVGIVGIGGLGHLGVQFAKALGYRTIALDNRAAGRQLAAEISEDLRPDLTVDSSAEDAGASVLRFTNGVGLGAVVVCTDSVPATSWSLGLLRTGGVLVPLGLPAEKWQFDSALMVFRELVIKGAYVASRDQVEEMLKVVSQHDIKSHVTSVSLDDVPDIVRRYQQSDFKGRLVVKI